MNSAQTEKKRTIDASGRSVGRIASEAALTLMGKDSPAFARNKVGDTDVLIINARKIRVTGNKLVEKVYMRHTGYPGGQRSLTMKQLISKKGHKEALFKAIQGMLPANKLRPIMLKKVSITE
ncbi:MAG: 50S ribosomal protein L13 [Candidatus Vogelbacteria bacterium CG10_big_fil_rev_8_21_14_0_10_51_16]|uniref:Large ribosomal subunit protein uL13 n=1 Tax=Candidatus Vogelbacteria bacterium CG10_big_fil_rev_8_21_14_0_10_51_16 TaxID=1975045 RepID=A0A2H0RE47_9BACT|nr:MAG: 50S ribosomal protein L13 [Candidatus Vogelbacteria bacterium CG10_big_fil_rev_8_21_14_0_10_51_16]